MTAVQIFTGLTELRTTSVEEKGILWVRGRRHDVMHDAFDDNSTTSHIQMSHFQ